MKLCFVFLFLLSATATAQNSEYSRDLSFSVISINDGLSQCTVMSVVQDSTGMMWIATLDGLNRYDGRSLEVMRHISDDVNSLAANYIKTLHVDEKGNLWAGHDGCFSRYDANLCKFSRHSCPGNVNSFCSLGNGEVLVATDSLLFLVDALTAQRLETKPYLNRSGKRVLCLYRNGLSIYIGTDSGLFFLPDFNNSEFRRFNGVPSDTMVQAILGDNQGGIWAGTEGGGLFHFTSAGNMDFVWTSANSELLSDYVRSLEYDSLGRLWIGTKSGLNIVENGKFSSFVNNQSLPGSLSHNSVRCISRDNQGGMWLGTFFGGVDYWHPLKDRFRTIVSESTANSLSDNVVNCIVADGDNLWIGTNGGFLNHFNPSDGNINIYKASVRPKENGMQEDYYDIKAILPDYHREKLYFGSHTFGLNTLDTRSGNMSCCGSSSDEYAVKDVYALLSLGRDTLLVGSLEGLRFFDRKTGVYSLAGEDYAESEVFALLLDSSKRLWIGSTAGLSVARRDADGKFRPLSQVKPPHDLSRINCIFESGSKLMWIGTKNGLWRLDPSTFECKRYSSEDGLQSDIVCGIEEDSWGRLWVSTENGLGCFNPYSETFRIYTTRDGLTSNQFNKYAHCTCPNGEMWFGGVSGIVGFNPEDMSNNSNSPQPLLSCLTVAGQKILPQDGSGILSKALSATEAISLKNGLNSFSLSFSVPDNLSMGHSSFSYILEGYDEDWRSAGEGRTASYINIPPGKYCFMLKSANSDGVWCESPVSLEVEIIPLWYKTLAMKIASILLSIILVAGIFWLILERSKIAGRMKLEIQESKHQEEIMQMKTRFFINISHELRTPLTLIITPIKEMMAKTSDPWMKRQLKYLDRNSNRLLHLVNQLLDYRRAELGVFKLRVQKENVHAIIAENCAYYDRLAVKKHIRYSLDSKIEGLELPIDAQYLELILNNLISNAFKYTNEGEIKVSADLKEDMLRIVVSDTGIGVSEADKGRLFERFYRASGNGIGSGIGLSLVHNLVNLHHGNIELESVEGKGSSFIVSLPANLSAYSESELAEAGQDESYTTNAREMYIMDSSSTIEEKTANEEVAAKTSAKWRILIADDDSEIRSYLKSGMGKQFEVVLAENGQEALDKLKEAEFDLVLTDNLMPQLDGVGLCTAIRRDASLAHIPVIIFSSSTAEENQLLALHSGADDYVSKPFSLPVLTAKIRNTILSKSKIEAKLISDGQAAAMEHSYNPADEEVLSRAIAVVNANLSNVDFSTEDFAREMHMSRSNLHLKIKAITGESALDFIRRIRFNEACRLLKDGRYTISEISDKVGFATASYFTTSFRRYMGCLPKDYARKAKEGTQATSD